MHTKNSSLYSSSFLKRNFSFQFKKVDNMHPSFFLNGFFKDKKEKKGGKNELLASLLQKLLSPYSIANSILLISSPETKPA